MHTSDFDLFVSIAPRSGIEHGHVFQGSCRLDPLVLTITLRLPDGSTVTRQHDRDTPLPVVLSSLGIDPAPDATLN